jgi:hypothetical protein
MPSTGRVALSSLEAELELLAIDGEETDEYNESEVIIIDEGSATLVEPELRSLVLAIDSNRDLDDPVGVYHIGSPIAVSASVLLADFVWGVAVSFRLIDELCVEAGLVDSSV